MTDPAANGSADENVKCVSDKNGKKESETSNGREEGKRHHKKHKKSRHLERIEAFKKKDGEEEEFRHKKIHVRSKDPFRIARQFEKGDMAQKSPKGGKGKAAPPPQKVNQICKICGKEPYLVERIVAEKSWWHKNCFRCKQCSKVLNLDAYMSHEGVIYCKPHHKELFQPKVVKSDIIEVSAANVNQKAILRHKEQERRMETIVRENVPVDLGNSVVKSTIAADLEQKYCGLENLDVGSKFKMFENSSDDTKATQCSSDRYGIMEKLKRLQEGGDLEELLAEIDQEMPSDGESEDEDMQGLTEVQKKTLQAEKIFGEAAKEKRDKVAASRRNELKVMREKLMQGTKDAIIDQFDGLLNASANKIKKTKVDVRSENAKKFREMFDRGEIPEGGSVIDRTIVEKEAELESMRKGKCQQRDYFKKLEESQGDVEQQGVQKEPKMLVGKLKCARDSQHFELDDEGLEMAPLSSRFSFFENHREGEEENPDDEDEEDATADRKRKKGPELESARRECKARSVLNKFREMEQKAMTGEDDVAERPRMKRFTPPRKIGSETESDYSEDGSDSDYTDSSYTSSNYSESDSDEEVDATLRAIREAARAKELMAKFEKWETSQDADDQARQIMIHDENGDSLETANNLRRKFEALQMQDEAAPQPQPSAAEKFRVKRFK